MESRISNFGRGWYTHSPAANAEAIVSLSPDLASQWCVESVAYGLDKDPAAPLELTVSIGGVAVIVLPLPGKCIGQLDFPERMLEGNVNETIEISISADSGGASAYLNVSAHANFMN